MSDILQKFKYFVFLIAVGAVIYFATTAVPVAEFERGQTQNGVAALTGFDFQNKIAAVSGWESYPDQLYTPGDFALGNTTAPVDFTGAHAETAQYGTHRLRLELPAGETLGITFRSLDYATKVYIAGREVGGMGEVGTTRETTTPRTGQLYFYITPETAVTEIVIQYANFVHNNGGRPPELSIGSVENIMRLSDKTAFSQTILIGVLFMAFLYHIGIFFLRGGRREYLWFALTCLLFALRSFMLMPLFFPEYNWHIAIRWEYIDVFTAFMVMALFLRSLLPGLLNKKVMLIAAALIGLYDIIIIFTSPVFFSGLVRVYQLICTLMVLYASVMLAISLRKGKLQNILAFLGIFLFTALTVNDALALNNLPNLGSNNLLPTGTVIFMLAYMLILTIDAVEWERDMQESQLRTETQLALQTSRYEQIVDNIEHTRQARHDLRHHLSVIGAYADRKDMDGLESYLAEYAGSLPKDDEPPLCANHAVDAVVRYYLARAKAAGAELDLRLNLPQKAGVPDADLCIVFGNIFENAVLAVERQTEGRKYINAVCETDEYKIILTVDNSMNLREKAKTGVGLSSVKAVAERSGGGARFEQGAGVYQSSVMLNMDKMGNGI